MGHLAKLSKILVPNNSSLPAKASYINDKCLSRATYPVEDIEKIIQSLDSKKAHGHLFVYRWR